MPIVVRELVVRASVEEAKGKDSCATPSEDSKKSSSHEFPAENTVAVCLEQVMYTLELKKER